MLRSAKFGRNRSKCGGDMTIFRFFKMAAAAILHFKIFEVLMVEQLLEGQNAPLCQIWSKSVTMRRRYVDFSIFQDGGAAAILDFQNFTLLTVGRLKRVEMRRHAKFGQNRSNRSRDMAIFRFFKIFQD